MAWGKTEEQKEAERQQREAEQRQAAAEQAAAEEQRRRAAYLASPLGRAEAAYANGEGFFQFTDVTAALNGQPSGFGSSGNSIRHGDGGVSQLAAIEAVGWHLEHVDHVFVETGATSTNRVLATGPGTVTEGAIHAFYLFRRVAHAGA